MVESAGEALMKSIAHYRQLVDRPVIGESALLLGVPDHPKGLRGRIVATSPVVRVGEDGEFETLNTVYRRLAEQ